MILFKKEKNDKMWEPFGDSKGIYSANVFCPEDYKNTNGWKQKIESINRKHGTNFFIKKMEVMGHLEMCTTHHGKIVGSRDVEGKLYYDDYYCKVRRGCCLGISHKKITILFIMASEQDVRKEIPEPSWFSYLQSVQNET